MLKRISTTSLALACATVTFVSCTHSVRTPSGPRGPRLRSELLALSESDQAIRRQLMAKGYANVTVEDVRRQDSVDSVNCALLKVIVEQHGWPDDSLVGGDGVRAAFLIVQHADADPEFQQDMLPFIRSSFQSGSLSGRDVAMLTDRILVRHGLPQRYGTQISIIDDAVELAPLEDSVHVDSLRAEMQLMPLDKYVQALKHRYRLDD